MRSLANIKFQILLSWPQADHIKRLARCACFKFRKNKVLNMLVLLLVADIVVVVIVVAFFHVAFNCSFGNIQNFLRHPFTSRMSSCRLSETLSKNARH